MSKTTSRLTPEQYRAKRDAWRAELSDRRTTKTRKIEINISAYTYGALCEAAAIHDSTPEQMLEALLEESETAVRWQNDGFPLDRDQESFEERLRL